MNFLIEAWFSLSETTRMCIGCAGFMIFITLSGMAFEGVHLLIKRCLTKRKKSGKIKQ